MRKLLSLLVCFCLCVMVLGVVEASSAITISDVNTSFDGVACEITVTWTTDDCTDNNVVKWDNTPCVQGPSWTYTETEGGGGKYYHSITFDASAATGRKVSFIIESSNDCGSASTTCAGMNSGPCVFP